MLESSSDFWVKSKLGTSSNFKSVRSTRLDKNIFTLDLQSAKLTYPEIGSTKMFTRRYE